MTPGGFNPALIEILVGGVGRQAQDLGCLFDIVDVIGHLSIILTKIYM